MAFLIATIITTIVNLGLGIIVYLRNPKGSANIHFFLMIFSIVGWIVTLFLYYVISDPLPLLFIGRLNFAISAPTTYFFYQLVYHFPQPTIRPPKIIYYTSTALTIFLVFISMFTPLIDKEEIARGAERIVVYGDFFFLWYVIFLINLLLGLFLLLVKIKKAQGLVRLQLLYLLIGFVLFIATVLVTNILLPALGNYSILQLGPLTTIPFVLFITYTIVKHRLMNMRLLLVRSIVFTLVVLFIGFAYTYTIFWVAGAFFGIKNSITEDLIYGVLVLFAATTYQPLRDFIRKVTSRIFYRNKYNRNILLSELNSTMVHTVDLKGFMERLLIEIVEGVYLTKGALYVFNNGGIYEKQLLRFEADAFDDEYILKLASLKKIIVTQEEEDQDLKSEFEKKEISIIVPISKDDTLHGVLILGEKRSGEILDEEDIQLFEILMPTLVVAIENAKSYKQIKDFNALLKERVEEQTRHLRVANEHLKELDKTKDKFVSLASHELRTPLTAIDGYVDMIKEGRYGKIDGELMPPLENIAKSTSRLILLVNDMLNISRIEAGRMVFNLKEVKLSPIINEVVATLVPVIGTKKIELKALDLSDYVVFTDEDKVKQVLNNLIGNALKFTEEGSIIIRATEKEQHIEVLVEDTGIGINKEDQEKLFGKFEQINTKQQGKPAGTGLGLYFSKELMKKLGGDVWLEQSTFGKGSTFVFSIPKAKSEIALRTQKTIEAEEKTHNAK